MVVKTKVWDASEHLDSEEMIRAYMNAVFEDDDPSLIAAALGDIARARGMTAIAKAADLSTDFRDSEQPDTKPDVILP